MKLSKKSAKRIASLFNSIQASHIMLQDGTNSSLWINRIAICTVALYEEFGIELPTLQHCKKQLAETV